MSPARTRARPAVWFAIAALYAVACVIAWSTAQRSVDVAPVIEGAPATVTVVYDPQWLALSLLAAAAAGIAVVLGVAGRVCAARG